MPAQFRKLAVPRKPPSAARQSALDERLTQKLYLYLLQQAWREARRTRRVTRRSLQATPVSGEELSLSVRDLVRRFRADCGTVHGTYVQADQLYTLIGDAIADECFGDNYRGMEIGVRHAGAVYYGMSDRRSIFGRIFLQPTSLPPRCELVVRFVEEDEPAFVSPFHRIVCLRASEISKQKRRPISQVELAQLFELSLAQFQYFSAQIRSYEAVRSICVTGAGEMAHVAMQPDDASLTTSEWLSEEQDIVQADVSGLAEGLEARRHNQRHPCPRPGPKVQKKKEVVYRGEPPVLLGPAPARKGGPVFSEDVAGEQQGLPQERIEQLRSTSRGIFSRVMGDIPINLQAGLTAETEGIIRNTVEALTTATNRLATAGEMCAQTLSQPQLEHVVRVSMPEVPASVVSALDGTAGFLDGAIQLALQVLKTMFDQVTSIVTTLTKTIFESRLWKGLVVACLICVVLWFCASRVKNSTVFRAFVAGAMSLVGRAVDPMFEAMDVSGIAVGDDPDAIVDSVWSSLWRQIFSAFGATDLTTRLRPFTSFLTTSNLVKGGAVALAVSRLGSLFTDVFKWVATRFDDLFGTSLLIKLFYSGHAAQIMACVQELQSIRAALSIYVRGNDLQAPETLSELAVRYHAITAKWGRLVATMKEGRVDPTVLGFINTGNAVFDSLGRYFGSRSCMERAQATMVTLAGDSGVGKTTLVKHLHSSVLRRFTQFTQDDVSLQLYVLPKGAKFFDGYKNQFTTVIDELFAVREVTGGTEQPAAASLLSMVSSFVFALNMASLEEKGTTFFNSKLVIATTNLTLEAIVNNASATMTFPPALRRRLQPFFTTVTVNPDFQSANGELDWAKQNVSDSDLVWSFHVAGIGRTVSYREFVDLIYQDIVKNITGSAQYMRKIMSEWEPLTPTADFNADGVLVGGNEMGPKAVSYWSRLVSLVGMASDMMTNLSVRDQFRLSIAVGATIGFAVLGLKKLFGLVIQALLPTEDDEPAPASHLQTFDVSGDDIPYHPGQLCLTVSARPNWRGAATALCGDYILMCNHTYTQLCAQEGQDPDSQLLVHNIVRGADGYTSSPATFKCTLRDFARFDKICPPGKDVAIVCFPPGVPGRRAYRCLVDRSPNLENSVTGHVLAMLPGIMMEDRRHKVVAVSGQSFVKRLNIGGANPNGSINVVRPDGSPGFENWPYEIHHSSHVPTEGYSGALVVNSGKRIFGMVCSRLSGKGVTVMGGGYVALSKELVDGWFSKAGRTIPEVSAASVSGEFSELEYNGVDSRGFLVEYATPDSYKLSGRGKSELLKTDLGRLRGTLVAPARLHKFVSREGEVIDPKDKALLTYGGPALGIDPTKVSDAVSVAIKPLLAGLASSRVDMSPISFQDAIRGIPGKLPSIDRSTSPGVPWVFQQVRDKRQAFGYDDFTFDTEQARAMLAEAQDIEDTLMAGADWRFIFRDFPKDEKRKKAKVLSGDTRFISSSQIALSLIFRRHFAPIMMHLRENHIHNGLAQYTCCFNEWDTVVNYVTNNLKWRGRIIAGDYSGFDKAQMPQILQEIGNQLSLLFGERAAFIRRLWRCSVVHTLHFDGDHLYTWTKSLPSGHPLTTLINSVINLTYIVLSYTEAGNPISDFWANMRPLVYGDDNLIGVGPDVVGFDQCTLPGLMSKWGQKYTDENKGDSDATPPFRDITEVTFLKRGFRHEPSENHGEWVPALAWETIVEMGNWIKERNPDPEPWAVSTSLVNAFEEAALHGEEKFSSFAEQTRQAYSSAYSMPIPDSRSYRSWWTHFEKTMQREDLFDFEAGSDVGRVQFGSEKIPGAPSLDSDLADPI
jgi:hypothetical protein